MPGVQTYLDALAAERGFAALFGEAERDESKSKCNHGFFAFAQNVKRPPIVGAQLLLWR